MKSASSNLHGCASSTYRTLSFACTTCSLIPAKFFPSECAYTSWSKQHRLTIAARTFVRLVSHSNLASALQLANIVADERMKLYLEFIWPKENKLKEYLTLVREASLAQLEDSSMDGNVFKAVERAPKL